MFTQFTYPLTQKSSHVRDRALAHGRDYTGMLMAHRCRLGAMGIVARNAGID